MSDQLHRRDILKHAAALSTGLAAANLLAADKEASAKKPRIKIGQIGVGHAHASKLSVYRASPDYEVVGIVEVDPELRRKAETQKEFKDLPWMTPEQLLNFPGLQAVLIEMKVRDLLDAAGLCIAAGKHVHIDKPAGASLPQYKQILEAAAQKKLMAQMGYMYRYNPGVLLLKEFLKQGWLGDIFEVHTVMSKVVPPKQREQLAEFSGGIFFELGCHVLDLVISVLGAPQKIASFNQHSSALNDGLLDNMLAVLSYPRATATVKSSALEVEGFDRRHLVVCGTEGTFHIQPLDDPAARVSLSAPHGDYKRGTQEIKFPRYHRYVGDAADMAKVIREEKEADYSYAHDLTVQTTLLTAAGMPLT